MMAIETLECSLCRSDGPDVAIALIRLRDTASSTGVRFESGARCRDRIACHLRATIEAGRDWPVVEFERDR